MVTGSRGVSDYPLAAGVTAHAAKMVVAHATVPSLIAALGCPPPAGGTDRRPLVTAATRCEALAYRRHIRRPRAVSLRPTGPVGSPRGGTPRAGAVFPPAFPLLNRGPALRPSWPRERNSTIDDASHGIRTDLHRMRGWLLPQGTFVEARQGRRLALTVGVLERNEVLGGPGRQCVHQLRVAARNIRNSWRQWVHEEGEPARVHPSAEAHSRRGPWPITRAAWPARDCGRGGRRAAAR